MYKLFIKTPNLSVNEDILKFCDFQINTVLKCLIDEKYKYVWKSHFDSKVEIKSIAVFFHY